MQLLSIIAISFFAYFMEDLFHFLFLFCLSLQFAIRPFSQVLQLDQTFSDALIYFHIKDLWITPFHVLSELFGQLLLNILIMLIAFQKQLAEHNLFPSFPFIKKFIGVDLFAFLLLDLFFDNFGYEVPSWKNGFSGHFLAKFILFFLLPVFNSL